MLKMAPVRIAPAPSSGVIAFWEHDALHDGVAPMADHVLMTFPSGSMLDALRTAHRKIGGVCNGASRHRDGHPRRLDVARRAR